MWKAVPNFWLLNSTKFTNIITFQRNIVDWDIAGMQPLKNYGRLIFDCELKIKANNDQKLKPR